jgi:acetyltransferase-like isoleucine patch superfamily enzyme
MKNSRALPWDWFPGTIPDNVAVDETAYIETTFSFQLFRSRRERGIIYGRGSSTYLGTMFDVGPNGRVTLGQFSLVHGARIICDSEISIGDYALISWNVVLMDSYRAPTSAEARRAELALVPTRTPRTASASVPARPICIERNVWIGFDACVLPGVTIGEGSIVGARSVVTASIPPFTIVAGNPACIIRELTPEERAGHVQ